MPQTATATLSIVVGPPFVVTSASLPPARRGQPYGPVQLQATGGAGAVTWAATGGVPPGVAVSPDGVIAGTPTAEGSFEFDVIATDSGS